ncbi:AzlC family ABC transporter permease [Azohydromonas sp.]|uniref:AzlC family ABC transporter permease n=1 Tax=Azohydromonas sp. TaxID=1872666 RepID=UPI002C097EC7|nr:AzlC family ABC transporter permease [Azohydromonas sp.]HMM86180.1 AzlC family ABC transporter permease [Azohydromonas sp.]
MHASPGAPTLPAWRHPEFRRGAREMTGVALGIAAWGLVTGVAMVKSGLAVPLAVLMSLVAYAGSAQLAALPLITSGAPVWVVLATAFCVNLRFLIFSAQWRPYFVHLPLAARLRVGYFTGDLNYVLFMRRFPEPKPAPEQLPYFWGGVVTNWSAWQLPSLAGILLADRVPTHWGLGFAGTLALLGVAWSMLKDRASWVAAAVAGCAAVAAYALPLRLNIVVAIAAAVAIALLVDHARPPGSGRRTAWRWARGKRGAVR